MARFDSYNLNVAPKRIFVNVPGAETDYTVVAAVSGKKILVVQTFMVAADSIDGSDVSFRSKGSGAGTAISPLFANSPNGGAVLPFSPVGWFETLIDEALTVGTTDAIGIMVIYSEV